MAFDITLNDSQLTDVVSQAILQSMDAEKQQTLIKDAIKYLLTPNSPYSGAPRISPLLNAFHQGIRNVTEKLIEQRLANDASVQQAINELITEAIQNVTVVNREQTVKALTAAITEGLTKRREF
jgi:hypothetical protein